MTTLNDLAELAQVGDIVTFKGRMETHGGLSVNVDHSQKWQCSGPGQFKPVTIDKITLRNGWSVSFAPRPMTPSDFSR